MIVDILFVEIVQQRERERERRPRLIAPTTDWYSEYHMFFLLKPPGKVLPGRGPGIQVCRQIFPKMCYDALS